MQRDDLKLDATHETIDCHDDPPTTITGLGISGDEICIYRVSDDKVIGWVRCSKDRFLEVWPDVAKGTGPYIRMHSNAYPGEKSVYMKKMHGPSTVNIMQGSGGDSEDYVLGFGESAIDKLLSDAGLS